MSGRSLVLLAAVALLGLGLGWLALRTPAVPSVSADVASVADAGASAASAPAADLATPTVGPIRVEESTPGQLPVKVQRLPDIAEHMRNYHGQRIDLDQLLAGPGGTSVVRGTVRSGAPVEGAHIEFTSTSRHQGFGDPDLSATTDAGGQYEIVLPSPATYNVRLEANGRAPVRRSVTVAAAVDAIVDFELPSSAVSGRVFGPDGRPVKYVRVQLSPDDATSASNPQLVLSAWTDDFGRFAFDGVEPGTFRIATDVMSMAGERRVRNAVPVVALRGIEVADKSAVDGLEIRLTAGATVLVQVLSPDRSPAGGAIVEWYQDLEVNGQSTADPAGIARLEGLAPGETRLYARGPSGSVRMGQTFDLNAGARVETTIRLQPGTLLSVHLEDANGERVTNWHNVTVRAATDRDRPPQTARSGLKAGQFGPLPEGEYDVFVAFGSKEVRQTVYVSGGTEQHLVVREPD